jgi:hypothetical protein
LTISRSRGLEGADAETKPSGLATRIRFNHKDVLSKITAVSIAGSNSPRPLLSFVYERLGSRF